MSDAERPVRLQALFLEADVAREAGRLEPALELYRQVIEAAPADAVALQRAGVVLSMLGRRIEAEALLRRALAIRPDEAATQHALAATLLAQGRYAEAGPLYQARFALGHWRPSGLPCPEWFGEDLRGKRLLVFPEMGFGDQLQHARFAALLRDQGVEVWLLCAPPLQRLLAASLPGVQVLAAAGEVTFPDPDYWTPAVNLMFLPGLAPETLPNRPYLRAPEPPPPLPSGFNVGVMTAGNPAHANDANRSLPAALAERLRAGLPGQVVELAPELSGARDFADTAALIGALDLVVTVDTAVAHLAGGLGARTFVLIPAIHADWRWMEGRSDSPWYPSVRLYRADPQAGWAPALDRLTRDVRTEADRAEG